MGSFRPMYTIYELKMLSFMALKCDVKFEEKLTCALKNDMRNLADFHQSTQKVSKLGV